MNERLQAFILWLIDRRLKKIEKRAMKRIMAIKSTHARRRAKIVDYTDEKQDYLDLLMLRENIRSINNPWQGSLAIWPWKVYPKNDKYVKKFPKTTWNYDDSQNEFFDEGFNGSEESIDRWIASYEAAAEEWEKASEVD